ncbi:MAG TPA: uroporphyrinogen decarboxylase [Actinomycetota bacterium]|jgi:uroporphyrinogen decarboxylase|nr:uroporphyrinogen decarboxylase [Actinomycetota bacterium]
MASDRFLRALRREPVDRTPVWFMRQAGRYLPEYRELRGDRDILESIRRPEEAVEITLQPLRRMPVDAAIVFSDIVVPLVAVGVPIRIVQGRGPVLDDPIRDATGVARLRALEPGADEPFVLDTVRLLAKELDVPLIGFAGAPFTLASYLIEGGPSRDHARTKALLWSEAALWNDLLDRLVTTVVAHVGAQVEAGASAIQIFDSWVGALAPATYETAVAPHMRRLFAAIGELGVPVIHFGVGTGELLAAMAAAGGDAIGIDARVPLDAGWARVGGASQRAVQGNLDPSALLAPWEVVEREALDVLARAGARDGHVFNLGHGVLPDTPVGTLQRLVDLVHERTQRSVAP